VAKNKVHEFLPISPITLNCPCCKAKSGVACDTPKGEVEVIHLERIEAAAAMDAAAKKTRNK
jgi:hypothetical protein